MEPSMIKRNKPVLKRTRLDIVLDGLTWAGLLFLLIYTLLNYRQLPETISMHFNWKGEVDRQGNKATIWIIPGILIIILIGLSTLNKYPQVFHYHTKITSQNAERQYTLATRLIRFLKLAIVIIFLFINIKTINVALNGSPGIGGWFLPIFILVICLPTVVYLYMAMKKDSTDMINKK